MIWVIVFRVFIFWSLFDGFIGLILPFAFVLLSRDILIVAAYMLFFTKEHFFEVIGNFKSVMGPAAWYSMSGFFLVGFLQIFNTTTPGLIVGLLGFKVIYFYWPLMILGFVFAKEMSRVRSLLAMVVYCSIPINVFGIYQFLKGPHWMIRTFGPGMLRALEIYQPLQEGKFLFRALGTFAISGIYAIFLVANIAFSLALIYSSKGFRGRVFWIACLAFNLVAVLVTGTRGALLLVILYLFVYSMMAKRVRATMVAALLIMGGFYIGFQVLGARTVDRFMSLQDVDMIQERTLGVTAIQFLEYADQYPLGKGLGAASQATRHLGGLAAKFRITVENYVSKLQVETGLPGVVIFYVFMFFLIKRVLFDWKYQFLEEDKAIVFPLVGYCVSQLFFQGIFGSIETSPGSLFLWTGFGFIARRAFEGQQARETVIAQVYG